MESPNRGSRTTSPGTSSERTRTVYVSKDSESGFGLTLSGDRPVSVQTVRPGGSADAAGIRERDVIVKVNGTHVTQSTHTEVVELIAGGNRVALTVIQAPEAESVSPTATLLRAKPPSSPSRSRIAAPQPPHTDAIRALSGEKMHTMQLMVEQEKRYVEQLRQDLATSNTSKTQQELDQALRRLAKLEAQLSEFKKTSGRPHSAIVGSPPSLPPPLIPPRPESSSQLSTSVVPPPLPARNRTSTSSLGITEASQNPPPTPPRRTTITNVPPPPQIPLPEIPSSKRTKATGASHERTKSSPSSLIDYQGRVSPRYETPPGTPPPPYQPSKNAFEGELVTWSNLLGSVGTENSATGIINMEDDDEDDFSEGELTGNSHETSALSALLTGFTPNVTQNSPKSLEGSKPFEILRDLLCHHAHLAVFMNYVISNSDPAAIFFYLITETYKLGTLKEMQRWAYEIFSSFLVPDAPLRVPSLENSSIEEIDRALKEDFDKEDVLRKLFWKARAKARVVLKEQLAEFRDKRAAGLGSIFGPPDQDLKLCIDNRTKELQVIEELILPLLDSTSQDLENATEKSVAVATSLATVLNRTFHTRGAAVSGILDKCPQFVSKEKRQKIFGKASKKAVQRQAHNFELKQYFQIKYCNHSMELIWGVAPQAYQCTHCGFDVHKKYVHKVEELCVGPSTPSSSAGSASASKEAKKEKGDKKGLFGIGRILSERDLPSRKASNAAKDAPKFYEDAMSSDNLDQGESRSNQIKNSPLVQSSEVMNQSSNGTVNDAKEASPLKTQHSTSKLLDKSRNQVAAATVLPTHILQDSKESKRVDRSQSCKLEKKEPKRGATRERRKHSDPNIPRSTTSDADSDAAIPPILDPAHPRPVGGPSGSSSSSSLSRSSLDSPATSMQDMAGGRSSEAATVASSQLSQINWDSDFETEPDPPDWRHSINQEELNQLNPREKKRQDVINEFFHTEKSHVRNLKVLDRLFFRPLHDSNIMPKELVEQLFPNLDALLDLHNQYNQKMKERAKSGFPIGHIGDILCEMFEADLGDNLMQVGAEFTKNQKWSIEELKDRRKRDHKLELFLTEAEKRPECRRLGLQALLPVEHQRLVKYPLLLEQLAKQCEDDEEYGKVRRCVDRSREILESIDRQVAEAQNIQRLAEIQRNLDTSGLEKNPDNPICTEYRNLDLTKHRLIYDGPLTLKLGDTKRFKTIDLHVVLLEDCIMLLQKQDDKYLLKFHTSTVANTAVGSQSHKFCHSPVIKFSAMLVRPVATDKRAFYLLNTTQQGPQIYELVASSTADRTQWFRHITDASNAYRARDSTRRGRYPADPHNGLEKGERGKTDDHLGLPDGDKKGQPAGRSQSFHEQSTSNREPHPERQPSSPPEERTESGSQKAGETENGSKKRFQRVEILKIAEPCPLIDPSQVVVTQGEILVADPVLTPLEKIRRKDLEVAQALEEKHRLVVEYYRLPFEDVNSEAAEAENNSETAGENARDVLLAALVLQVKSLSDLVNESLTVSEEDAMAAAAKTSSSLSASTSAVLSDVPSLSSLASEAVDELPSVKLLKRLQPPTHKLIAITKSLNHHLTSLLEIMQDRDEERDRLRTELHRTKALLTQSSVRTSLASTSEPQPQSRPASFISVEESSGQETASERNQESEDDFACATPTSAQPPVTEATEADSPTKIGTPNNNGGEPSQDFTFEEKTIDDPTEDDSAV